MGTSIIGETGKPHIPPKHDQLQQNTHHRVTGGTTRQWPLDLLKR